MKTVAEVREKRQRHPKLVDRHSLIKVNYQCFEVSALPNTIITAETREGEVVRIFDADSVRLQFRKVGAEKWQM